MSERLRILVVADDTADVPLASSTADSMEICIADRERASALCAPSTWHAILLDVSDAPVVAHGLRPGIPGVPILAVARGYAVAAAESMAVDELIPADAAVPPYLEARLRAHAEHARLRAEAESLRTRCAAREQDLQDFTYAVSHDLRNPLHAICAFSDMLADSLPTLSAEADEYLQRLRAATKRLDDMVTALLALSRLGQRPLSVEEVDIAALCRRVVADLQHGAPDRAVRVDIPDSMRVRCDAEVMRTAVHALLDNAWKFTRPVTEPHIRVWCAPDASGTQIVFADNGVGFDMRYASRLFSPFQRLHTERQFPGIGMGLALARRAAQRHGGTIDAHAAPDQGATFTLWIPASCDDA